MKSHNDHAILDFGISARSCAGDAMEDSNPFKDFQAGHWTNASIRVHPDHARRSWIGDQPNLRSKTTHGRSGAPQIRHESGDSLSSIKSSSSAPGLTDTSDSELSFDEDSQYNISTSQLWDSFWQSVERKSTSKKLDPRPPKIQSVQSDDYFTLSVLNHYTEDADDENNDDEDDTLRRGTSEIERKPVATAQPLPRRNTSSRQSRHSCSRPSSPKGPTRTYSIYPKQQPLPPARQLILPPRTSSRAAPLPPLPQAPLPQPSTRSQKVNGLLSALKPSRSSHNLHAAHVEAAAEARPPLPLSSQSAPTSPGLPNPLYASLRPSKSAFNLKQKINETATQHNPTAPLAPLVPLSSLDRALPELPLDRPSLPRFVSVFEMDSDCESDAETNNGLAKRIARGLHKKTPSGRKNVLPPKRPATAGQDAQTPSDKEVEEAKSALARRRGGSLGRIFGLKYRH
ncbi:hypothetical protein Micbo1qcDRAFT_220673 [Microdochium bolleyi]|uniref:Uncharacterized protein n=1 Tax=Microdochium bolleyi TaxID=196109 RepID=A0A136JAH2_9PEZI|nr:hypothetical protein Micbo1qcDRAFT_220673 [Microdochium bolleyi]